MHSQPTHNCPPLSFVAEFRPATATHSAKAMQSNLSLWCAASAGRGAATRMLLSLGASATHTQARKLIVYGDTHGL